MPNSINRDRGGLVSNQLALWGRLGDSSPGHATIRDIVKAGRIWILYPPANSAGSITHRLAASLSAPPPSQGETCMASARDILKGSDERVQGSGVELRHTHCDMAPGFVFDPAPGLALDTNPSPSESEEEAPGARWESVGVGVQIEERLSQNHLSRQHTSHLLSSCTGLFQAFPTMHCSTDTLNRPCSEL